MPRYEQQEEAKLTPEQRRIWDECKAGPRGSVPPPVHVWLKSPGLADHAHKLGAHVRFAPPYTPKQTEIAILVTARYWTAQFEWAAHVRLGLQARLEPGTDRRDRRSPNPRFRRPRRDNPLIAPTCPHPFVDVVAYAVVLVIAVGEFVDEPVDLAGLIGYYSFVSTTLNVFEVPTPPGAKLLSEPAGH